MESRYHTVYLQGELCEVTNSCSLTLSIEILINHLVVTDRSWEVLLVVYSVVPSLEYVVSMWSWSRMNGE